MTKRNVFRILSLVFLKYSDLKDTLEIDKVWSRKDIGKQIELTIV